MIMQCVEGLTAGFVDHKSSHRGMQLIATYPARQGFINHEKYQLVESYGFSCPLRTIDLGIVRFLEVCQGRSFTDCTNNNPAWQAKYHSGLIIYYYLASDGYCHKNIASVCPKEISEDDSIPFPY